MQNPKWKALFKSGQLIVNFKLCGQKTLQLEVIFAFLLYPEEAANASIADFIASIIHQVTISKQDSSTVMLSGWRGVLSPNIYMLTAGNASMLTSSVQGTFRGEDK